MTPEHWAGVLMGVIPGFVAGHLFTLVMWLRQERERVRKTTCVCPDATECLVHTSVEVDRLLGRETNE